MSPWIFVSYRREDAAAEARGIRDILQQEFGRDAVFMDISSIEPGVAWPDALRAAVSNAHVVLPIIGSRWLEARDQYSRRRIDLPQDWVAQELTIALATAGTTIIPVLVGDARPFPAEALPASLSSLATHQHVEIRRDRFDHDVQLLLAPVRKALAARGLVPPTPPSATQRAADRVHAAAPRIEISRLPRAAGMFLGRQRELTLLDEAWKDSGGTHIALLVAPGGVGKTSLVDRWLEGLRVDGWRGAGRVFAWSFYDQGVHGDRQTSDDQFLQAALQWFEIDHDMAASSWDKGRLLAKALSEQRTLLILDGLEPLQYPPGPLGGKLRAFGIDALLTQLARAGHPGLCLVTTRESVVELTPYAASSDRPTGSVMVHLLDTLSDEDGGRLLHRVGVRRSGAARIREDDPELREASRELRGHALALTLLGSYLRLAHNGNVRERDRVTFDRANQHTGGAAFTAMAAYEQWFQREEVDGGRLLAAVRLLGFFDRPADVASLRSLCDPPIHGLTEPLAGISTSNWNITRSRLEDSRLVWPADERGAIDAHPLVRGYFAGQLRAQNAMAWREGHRRLYNHLQAAVPDQPQTFADISVLLRAVLHGCEAGEYDHALERTYRERILQGVRYYHTVRLAAYGAGLGGLRGFFDEPWERPVGALTLWQRAFVVHEAAVHLTGLGRLEEAIGPFEVAFRTYAGELSDFSHAALSGRYLTELYMMVGRLDEAIAWGRKALGCAEKADSAFERMAESSTLGRALFRAGRFDEAERAFLDAEALFGHDDVNQYRYWYFFWEFDFCELLLSQGRHAEAWERANAGLRNIELTGESLISTSQIHLAIGRVLLERGAPEDLATAAQHVERAVAGLRAAGHPLYLIDGLLGRAMLRGRQGNPAAVKAELDAAWDIAERGAMRLAMIDILLLRSRLLDDHGAGEEAARKIAQCNYGRHAAAVRGSGNE